MDKKTWEKILPSHIRICTGEVDLQKTVPENFRGDVHPDEWEYIYERNAVIGRKIEFLAGRAALHTLMPGVSAFVPDKNGYPHGDTQYSYSVTHTAYGGHLYYAAAVLEPEQGSVGVDCEVLAQLSTAVQEIVLTESEQRTVESHNNPNLSVVMFSLKEAFYKAAYPIVWRYIDFPEVEVVLESNASSSGSCTFKVTSELEESLSEYTARGHWICEEDMVCSAVLMED